MTGAPRARPSLDQRWLTVLRDRIDRRSPPRTPVDEWRDPDEQRALVNPLMSGQVSSIIQRLQTVPPPSIRAVPSETRGFRIRLALDGAKPPVWRRLELAGDLTLPRVHDVIQAAMGWSDSHLHRFRTAGGYRSPHFLTGIEVEEGEDGVPEDGIRLDQLLADKGDKLWYEYDFGDGWEHVLTVEEVLDDAPTTPRCLAGRMACPPEDCGGIGGYQELVVWVRSGYADALLPEGFQDEAHGRGWLPVDWHPDYFDVEETNAALAVSVAEPVAVTGELAELAERLEGRGVRLLREVLGRPMSHGPATVSDLEAARLTETYRTFLDVVGDGVALTAAGYLPPGVVEQVARRAGISEWWIGKANREDLTYPVALVRATARALGLVSVRKGHLSPTAAAKRAHNDPQALWRHIVNRMPLGVKDAERQAGWLALAAVASGIPAKEWSSATSDLMFAAGWRSGRDPQSPPSAHSPTLDVLRQLAGAARAPWGVIGGIDLAVGATARAVIRRE